MRLLLLALVLVAAGCDSTDPEPHTGALVLGVAETRGSADVPARPQATLFLGTEEVFDCLGYRLDTDVRRSGNTLDLSVRGVLGPQGACATALGPATFETPLDLAPGTYRLRVRSGATTDEFRLTVAADRFEIDPVRATTTRAPEPLVWRTPERTFAYSCGTFTGDEALCDRFRERLEGALALALTPVPVPDAGVWPYPRSASGHYYDAPSLVYRYASEADFEAAKGLLRAFSAEALRGRMGAGLSVENWRGDAGRSWVYAQE